MVISTCLDAFVITGQILKCAFLAKNKNTGKYLLLDVIASL